jgi:hypothetical protein
LGYLPVNRIAHQAIKAITPAAMVKKYSTMYCGIIRIILKKMVNRDIFSGYIAPKVMG